MANFPASQMEPETFDALIVHTFFQTKIVTTITK
jgi:hypothetical protein